MAASPPRAEWPCIATYAVRERARSAVRSAFPRRRARTTAVHTADELKDCLHRTLVDAVVVDVAAPGDEAVRIGRMAPLYPSTPFFGLLPLRVTDAPLLARCAADEFADALVEGIDDEAIHELVAPHCFTERFATALRDPPESLGLTSTVQRATWRIIVSHGGRPLKTTALAEALGVSREHLSRIFSGAAAPNLKRVIDLVRLLAAAELAKNPGYDIADVARVLQFASASHLSTTSQRVTGSKPVSLSRLRGVDLIERFTRGRRRSRP